jgi:hypothetical protein
MKTDTIHHTMNEQAQRRWVYICLLPLVLVLFTLSSCTVIPNSSQTPKIITGTTPAQTFQMSALLTASAAVEGCSDIMYPDRLNGQEIRIYFNDCSLHHLSAIAATIGAILAIVDAACSGRTPLTGGGKSQPW